MMSTKDKFTIGAYVLLGYSPDIDNGNLSDTIMTYDVIIDKMSTIDELIEKQKLRYIPDTKFILLTVNQIFEMANIAEKSVNKYKSMLKKKQGIEILKEFTT